MDTDILKQLLGSYNANRATTMNALSQLGQGQTAQVNRYADIAQKNAAGDLMRRGLTSSNLAPVTAVGIEGQRQSAVMDIQESTMGQMFQSLMGMSSGLSQGLMGLQKDSLSPQLARGEANAQLMAAYASERAAAEAWQKDNPFSAYRRNVTPPIML